MAVLLASTSGAVARDHNQRGATIASQGPDLASCVVPSAIRVPGTDGIAIDHIRFEDVPSLRDSPSVILRFDIRNDTAASVAGVIVSVALFANANRTPGAVPLLERPLEAVVRVPLRPGFSFDYTIRLKNLSLESACESDVVVVGDAVPYSLDRIHKSLLSGYRPPR
jgi:hypothetical protein